MPCANRSCHLESDSADVLDRPPQEVLAADRHGGQLEQPLPGPQRRARAGDVIGQQQAAAGP
jgi:uncharacterized ParB-like nuclease family protein